MHAPLWQLVGGAQGGWLIQLPVASHVCGVAPMHCVWSGAHTPTHVPLTHVWFRHGAGGPQIPLALQLSTLLPKHCAMCG
jgi:hypothetical protein